MSEIKYLSVPFRIYYWTRKQRGEYSDYMKYVPPYLQRILSPREAERIGKIISIVFELEKQKLYTELLRTGQKTVSAILQTAYKVYQRSRKELSTSLEKTINMAIKEAEKSIRDYIGKLVKYHTSLAEYKIYKEVEKWVKTQLPQFIEDMANWVVGQIQLQTEAEITSPEFIKEMVEQGESVILPALINKIAKDAAKIYVATVNELKGLLGEKAYEIANQLVEEYKQYIKFELAEYGFDKANEIIDKAATIVMNILNKIKQDLKNIENKLRNVESKLRHLNNKISGQKPIDYYKQEILKYYLKDLNHNGKLDMDDVMTFVSKALDIINKAPPQYRNELIIFATILARKFTSYVKSKTSNVPTKPTGNSTTTSSPHTHTTHTTSTSSNTRTHTTGTTTHTSTTSSGSTSSHHTHARSQTSTTQSPPRIFVDRVVMVNPPQPIKEIIDMQLKHEVEQHQNTEKRHTEKHEASSPHQHFKPMKTSSEPFNPEWILNLGIPTLEDYKREIDRYYMKDLNHNGKIDIGDVVLFLKKAREIISKAPRSYRRELESYMKELGNKMLKHILYA